MDRNEAAFLSIVVIALALMFIAPILACCSNMNERETKNIEEQIRICKENGGIPDVYIDNNLFSHPQRVKCNWKDN